MDVKRMGWNSMKTAKISLRLPPEEMDIIDEIKISQGFDTITEVIRNAVKEYAEKTKKKKGNKDTIEIQLSKATSQLLEQIIENTDYQNKESFIVDTLKKEIVEFQKTITSK